MNNNNSYEKQKGFSLHLIYVHLLKDLFRTFKIPLLHHKIVNERICGFILYTGLILYNINSTIKTVSLVQLFGVGPFFYFNLFVHGS